ncbi:MAG: glycosyltransferase family 39 protein [bacterium]
MSLSVGKTLVLVGLLFLGGLFVRLYNLGGQSLECEELYTIPAATGHQYVYVSDESNAEQSALPESTGEYQRLLTPDSGKGLTDVNRVLGKNVHMPLYFYLLHYWIRIFGTSELVLRLPSVVFGALAVVLIFFLGSELLNPLVGFVAALLIAFMPEQIHYSQQARMYPLLALLAIASTYAITLARKYSSSRLPYILFAVLSVAGLYTHYEYVFVLAAQSVYIWIASPLGRAKKFYWFVTEGAVVAAFSPWLLIGLAQSRTSQQIIAWARGPLSPEMVIAEIFSKLTRLMSVPEAPLGWVSVVAAYGLVLWGLLSLRFQRATLWLLCLWIVFPIAGILFLDHLLGTRAIGIMRYWIVIAPAVYLLIAVGVQNLNSRTAQLVVVTVLGGFLFSTALLTARGDLRAKPDRHKEMAQFIDSQIANSNHETILSEGVNSIPLALAYYGKTEVRMLRYKWLADQLGKQSLGEIIGRDQSVWLLSSPPGRAAKLLEENGYQLTGRSVLYGHILLSHYAQRAEPMKPR